MKDELVILGTKNNKVTAFNKRTKRTVEYSKFFLKRRFEMGWFIIENPELLYSTSVKFV